MRIAIDGQETGWEYEQTSTLQEVMFDIQRRLMDDGKVVAEVKLDETTPGLDMTLTPDKVTVDKILAISFKTTPYKDALISYFESAGQKLEEVAATVPRIVEMIVADKVDAAMNSLKDGLDTLIWFFDVLHQATANGSLDIESISIRDKKLFDFVNEFNTMLNDFVMAMKNNDLTLINDYLEYELEPKLNDLSEALPRMAAAVRG